MNSYNIYMYVSFPFLTNDRHRCRHEGLSGKQFSYFPNKNIRCGYSLEVPGNH